MKQVREIPVLFENDSCLILNKPPGLAVQGGEGVKVSLDSILSARYSPRPLLVHRLDRDTSGVILVAKNREAAAGFSALLAGGAAGGGAGKKGGVIKQYAAVCAGVPSPEQGIITLPLEGQGGRRGKGPQESLTRYKALAAGTAGEEPCTLLEIEPGTGRMHQIRRHLASIGCPLLGDDKYGDFALNKRLRKACGLKHLLLHAARLVIPPTAGLIPEGADIRAPEPDYFHLPGLPRQMQG